MGKNILIADDCANTRLLLGNILKNAGHTVVKVHDGQQALSHIAKSHFDLLITDLNMPNLDGLDLIHAVRKTADDRVLPIIMLSGNTQAQKKREGKLAGASMWISKPFKREQLLTVVRSVLAPRYYNSDKEE